MRRVRAAAPFPFGWLGPGGAGTTVPTTVDLGRLHVKPMSRARRRTQLKNAQAAPKAGMRQARGGMHKTAGKARMTRGQEIGRAHV